MVMFRIVTFNANGIRSAAKKNFWPWLDRQNADVLCVQELKGHASDFGEDVLHTQGWHLSMQTAQKKGYSGVALYTRQKSIAVQVGFGSEEFDAEGRYVHAELENFIVASVYFPSGSSSEERQAAKYRFFYRLFSGRFFGQYTAYVWNLWGSSGGCGIVSFSL